MSRNQIETCLTDQIASTKLAMKRFGPINVFLSGCVAGFVIFSAPARADTVTFNFAQVGTSFSAFLPPDSPLIGREVISARIYLNVESFSGSDADNFFTDLSFPISPFPGNENVLALIGSDLGWSGSGEFDFFQETTLFNGIFVSARFAGETPGENFDGTILEGSWVEFDFASVPDNGGISMAACAGVALAAFAYLVRRSRGSCFR